MDNDTFTGVLKFFNHGRGYGFIIRDGGGKDMFCPDTGFADPSQVTAVKGGTRVQFKIEQGDVGPQACSVQVIQ